MPPSTADAPITTSAHFIQKQIVNSVFDEQPGDTTALTGADKLLKPGGRGRRGGGGVTEERISKIKICSHWYMGGLTTVPLDTLHFKLLITFWIKRNNKITVTYLAIHKLASNNSFCNSLPTEHEA